MNTFRIKSFQLDGRVGLSINDRIIDSSEDTAKRMKREDTGYKWGSAEAQADLTAAAICMFYIDNGEGGRELSERFKNEFVKNWPADQDLNVEIDMDKHYGDFRARFWNEWWLDLLTFTPLAEDCERFEE